MCLGVCFYSEGIAKCQISIFRRELSEKSLRDEEPGTVMIHAVLGGGI